MTFSGYEPQNNRIANWLPEYVSRVLHAFFKVGDTFTGVQMAEYLEILYPEDFADLKRKPVPHRYVAGILGQEYQKTDWPACKRLARISGKGGVYTVEELPERGGPPTKS